VDWACRATQNRSISGSTAFIHPISRGRVKDFLGQDVYVVDPFKIVEGVKRNAFNPLVAIDLEALTVTEDISLLAKIGGG